jgi:hypothetical protein
VLSEELESLPAEASALSDELELSLEEAAALE